MNRAQLRPQLLRSFFLAMLAGLCTNLSVYTQHTGGTATVHDEQLNPEADMDFQQEREAWIEQMHQIEPGLNWRVINAEVREANYRARAAQAERYKANWKGAAIASADTIAGKIIGSWAERGSANQAGRMLTADIDFDRGLVYAASDGGNIWRGTINGEDWASLNDQMQIYNIRLLRVLKRINRPQRLLAVGNSPAAVHYSDDDGETWQRAVGLDTMSWWGWTERAAIANNQQHTIYIIGGEWDYAEWRSTNTLYRSDDLGLSFTNVFRYNALSDLYIPRNDDPRVYFLRNDTLYLMNPDNSLNITSVLPLPNKLEGVDNLMLTGSGSKHLYVAAIGSGTSQFYESNDYGKTWEERGSVDFGPFNRNNFAASLEKPGILYFGGIDAVRSLDSGRTWKAINSWGEYYGNPAARLHADIPAVTIIPDADGGEHTLISTDGGIYFSYGYGDSVHNISLYGLGTSQYYSTYTCRFNTNYIYAGSQDQGFQRSELDSGGLVPFRQTISGDYAHITSSDSGRSIWTVYPGFSLYYRNFTVDDNAASLSFSMKGHLWLPPIVADPLNPRAAYLAGGGPDSGAFLYKLTDVGDSIFSEILPYNFSPGATNTPITAFALSPMNPDYRYAMTTGRKFFVTTNGGEYWNASNDFEGPEGHYFYGNSIIPSAITLGTVYIGGSGYSNPGVFVTRDNGATFTEMYEGMPQTLTYGMAITPDEKLLFAATDAGPYMYVFDDERWYYIGGLDAPDQTYWSVDYVPSIRTARFGTYGRGIWDFALADINTDTTTTTGVANQRVAPSLSLQVSPNPVTDGATVQFTMPQRDYATLKIYDITGRVVTQLANGLLDAGKHSLVWNGTSVGGAQLPAGTYVCVLNTLGAVSFIKVTLH